MNPPGGLQARRSMPVAHSRPSADKPRNEIAALDASTGAATGWNRKCPGAPPAAESTRSPSAARPSSRRLLHPIGGAPRASIAALDAFDGWTTAGTRTPGGEDQCPWRLKLRTSTSAGASSTTLVWSRSAAGPQLYRCPRHRPPARGDELEPGKRTVGSGVEALAITGSTVYAGGAFTVGTEGGNNIVAFDRITGARKNWNPIANGKVRALGSGTGLVVGVGGAFTGFDAAPQSGIAEVRALAVTSCAANATAADRPWGRSRKRAGPPTPWCWCA